MRDLKYLIAYVAPLSTFLAIHFGGPWSLATVYLAFGIIPFLELIIPYSKKNLSTTEENNKAVDMLFDVLLHLNVPILLGLTIYYFHTLQAGGLTTFETVGITLSIGVLVGSTGINVAHELGHRVTRYEQFLAKLLLMLAMYMHFFIEHNRGHHKNVSTPEDPASARYGENLYAFWLRSIVMSYLDAWKLEAQRLQRVDQKVLSLKNEMIQFQIIQISYLLAVGLIFGWAIVPFAIAIAFLGVLMLETVNYIEHYGLQRKKLESGRYENVRPTHSWNSNHELGRIFLYELTRHSDHHFKATRKYQVLRHFEESPQLPLGYPASMLMSMLPPLWFGYMNKRVKEVRKKED